MCSLRIFWCALVTIFAGSFLCGIGNAQANAPQLRGDEESPFASVNESLFRAADSTLGRSLGTDTVAAVSSDDHAAFKPAGSESGGSAPRSETLIDSILAREGVPVDLSAVVKVESSGNRRALSQRGARGLWQLMPDTARRYGLQVDARRDERIDVEKSTTAAARYLHDLYAQFGSWPLALAAYNTGESNLQRAIDRAQSNQFAVLSFLKVIPAETRSYVPAVLAKIALPFASLQPHAAESTPADLVYAGSASPEIASREGVR